ncbi:hypothetical protein Pelo_4306 [Pelomyxa schiedti]|nr:hypothetical protein Pelo_4306 [Pelomyxa schiedti]
MDCVLRFGLFFLHFSPCSRACRTLPHCQLHCRPWLHFCSTLLQRFDCPIYYFSCNHTYLRAHVSPVVFIVGAGAMLKHYTYGLCLLLKNTMNTTPFEGVHRNERDVDLSKVRTSSPEIGEIGKLVDDTLDEKLSTVLDATRNQIDECTDMKLQNLETKLETQFEDRIVSSYSLLEANLLSVISNEIHQLRLQCTQPPITRECPSLLSLSQHQTPFTPKPKRELPTPIRQSLSHLITPSHTTTPESTQLTVFD